MTNYLRGQYISLQRFLKVASQILLLLSFLSVTLSLYYIFMLVPDEAIMGAVQRIFYFHVGSAFTCYFSFAIIFGASVIYLNSKNALADAINESATVVGFLFCTITLFTGMIWGYSAWNTWFRWEPRLVTTLMLWLIMLSMVVTRYFTESRQKQLFCAILGVLGSFTVPIVWLSVKMLPSFAQLHPQVIERQGLKSPLFVEAMVISTSALFIFFLLLFVLLLRIWSAELSVLSLSNGYSACLSSHKTNS